MTGLRTDQRTLESVVACDGLQLLHEVPVDFDSAKAELLRDATVAKCVYEEACRLSAALVFELQSETHFLNEREHRVSLSRRSYPLLHVASTPARPRIVPRSSVFFDKLCRVDVAVVSVVEEHVDHVAQLLAGLGKWHPPR